MPHIVRGVVQKMRMRKTDAIDQRQAKKHQTKNRKPRIGARTGNLDFLYKYLCHIPSDSKTMPEMAGRGKIAMGPHRYNGKTIP
jgi:hypothetical protein